MLGCRARPCAIIEGYSNFPWTTFRPTVRWVNEENHSGLMSRCQESGVGWGLAAKLSRACHGALRIQHTVPVSRTDESTSLLLSLVSLSTTKFISVLEHFTCSTTLPALHRLSLKQATVCCCHYYCNALQHSFRCWTSWSTACLLYTSPSPRDS